jgi:hypothetical protein
MAYVRVGLSTACWAEVGGYGWTISIRLFKGLAAKFVALVEVLESRSSVFEPLPVLLIVSARRAEAVILATYLRAHVYGDRGRSAGHWAYILRVRAGFVFIHARQLFELHDISEFDLICMDAESISDVSVAVVGHRCFYVTKDEFTRVREHVPRNLRVAFMFE